MVDMGGVFVSDGFVVFVGGVGGVVFGGGEYFIDCDGWMGVGVGVKGGDMIFGFDCEVFFFGKDGGV